MDTYSYYQPERIQKAVALRYDTKGMAPKVIAVGAGEIAEKILELALVENIPVHKNDSLVDILCKLKVNQDIPSETFKVVAGIFAFLFKTDALWRQKQIEKLKTKLESEGLNSEVLRT